MVYHERPTTKDNMCVIPQTSHLLMQ